MREVARAVDVEEADLGAPALVREADHDHGVVAHQHLVVPRPARLDARAERIRHGNRRQLVALHAHGEEASPSKHDQVIAVDLDDAAVLEQRVVAGVAVEREAEAGRAERLGAVG